MPGPDVRSFPSRSLAVWAGLLLVMLVVVRTAWMCDDAYITMRSVDNAVHGYGLRWNVAERVQSYTHPAWLALILPFYFVTRDAFYTVLTLQIALTAGVLWIGARRIAVTPDSALLWLAAFTSSKALIDFSTSGLENSLTHLVLLLLLVAWLRDRDRQGSLAWFGTLVSVLLLCRLDMAVLIAPLVVSAIWPIRRPRLRSFIVGLLPFVAWELFSLVYYGQLFPNTALAKLPPGVAPSDLIAHGFQYLAATAYFDPMTPVLLAGSCVLLVFAGRRTGRLVAAGVLLHVMYVISVGGDFMTGRFLTPALVAALAGVVACVAWPAKAGLRLGAAAALLAGSLLGPAPPVATGRDFAPIDAAAAPFDRHGVTDERRFYYPSLGLWRALAGDANPADDSAALFGRARRAVAAKEGIDVVSASVIGVFGYFAGPGVYIVDRYGLADPFLARLPPKPGWRVGHYERAVPAGYVDSRREGRNLIEDPQLRPLFDRVDLVTRGRVWGSARLGAIARSFVSR